MPARIALAAFAATLLSVPATVSRASDLPDGAGRDLVEANCTGCHAVSLIQRSAGYSLAHWDALTATMIDLSADPESRAEILGYLATHFPPRDNRAASPVPGERTIAIEQWRVPTLGQRSRDPVEGPDGAIWWAGQWGNLIGRLDPRTGEMREYPLPEGAMPHTVEIGPGGAVWYTGNKNASMGRLDPATGDIAVYPMPDPAARDLHTAVFDSAGILWFSLQGANMIGRLDASDGSVRLLEAPTPGSRPYGVKIDAGGDVWVACNGAPCLLKVDAATMAVTQVDLPTPGTTVRRLDIDPDGIIWFVNSSKGKLGRYDPATGAIREWDSPSGPASHPYALAVHKGGVWYNESGVRPDMLVRFDPPTETFQSWPIPSGEVYAGILRHMRDTRDGGALLIHQSGTNHIARVTVEEDAPRTQ